MSPQRLKSTVSFPGYTQGEETDVLQVNLSMYGRIAKVNYQPNSVQVMLKQAQGFIHTNFQVIYTQKLANISVRSREVSKSVNHV